MSVVTNSRTAPHGDPVAAKLSGGPRKHVKEVPLREGTRRQAPEQCGLCKHAAEACTLVPVESGRLRRCAANDCQRASPEVLEVLLLADIPVHRGEHRLSSGRAPK